MKKIPVLGTQSLNSLSNLKKLITSIDYPVEVLSIVINNENVDFFKELKLFCDREIDPKLIEKVDISFHPTNLGCAGSWNYHFKSYPYADYFILICDDICLGVGDLKVMVDSITDGGFGLVFYNQGTKYAFYRITKNTLKKVGIFDENIWPAYHEDTDYEQRVNHFGINYTILSLAASHCFGGTSTNLRATGTSPKKLEELAGFVKTNEKYYNNKWSSQVFGNPIEYAKFDFNWRENKVFRVNKFL